MKYRIVADEAALDFLFACTSKDRQALAKLFGAMMPDPFQAGDYEEFDDVGRAVQVKRTGAFLITFWPDHAVGEIRVVRVERIG